MKFTTFPRIQRRSLQTSTSQSTKSLRLPRKTHRVRPSSNPPHHACIRLPTFLQPSRTPAPAAYFATCRNPCACHAKHFQPPKTSRAPGVLTILTSKSFSRAGVVQILWNSTSKSAPSMPRFNDFDFQIALARRRGANLVEMNVQNCSEHASF